MIKSPKDDKTGEKLKYSNSNDTTDNSIEQNTTWGNIINVNYLLQSVENIHVH